MTATCFDILPKHHLQVVTQRTVYQKNPLSDGLKMDLGRVSKHVAVIFIITF